MLLKIIIFALLFETIAADHENFSVGKVWQIYARNNKLDTCACAEPIWQYGVQELYDGTRKASWEFSGRSREVADVVMNLLKGYIVKLMYFSNSNSTVLTTSSSAILNTMSNCNKFGKSSIVIIREYRPVMPVIVKDLQDVVKKLGNILGLKVTSLFFKAIGDLGSVCMTFITRFLKDPQKKIIYEPVYKSLAFLMNAVALIAETLLDKCDSASTEVQEAVTTLTLILHGCSISVQGINSCVQDYLIANERPIPKNLKVCSKSFEYALVETGQAVNSVVFPFTKGIKVLLGVHINSAMAFNKAVKGVLGEFDGVPLTVQEITQNLFKNAEATANVTITFSRLN